MKFCASADCTENPISPNSPSSPRSAREMYKPPASRSVFARASSVTAGQYSNGVLVCGRGVQEGKKSPERLAGRFYSVKQQSN
jgi:hypothetical protein